MTDTIAVTGVVGTPPSFASKEGDLKITSFRLASTQRRFDKGRDRWVDMETNWFTVTAFRQLAVNVSNSVLKGDKVVVTGRLRVREWENGEKKGTNVEIEAASVGHDLAWGTTTFTKVSRAVERPEPEAGFPSAPFGSGSVSSGPFESEPFGGELAADSHLDDDPELGDGDGDDEEAEPVFGSTATTAPF